MQDVFLEGLNQPFGMSLIGNQLFVGNTDGVVVFPYEPGADRITALGRKIVDFKPGGHWTRSLLPSLDGKKLYAGVGSLTNIADEGMEVEEGRAAVWELDLEAGTNRVFAGGLRNAVGLAWAGRTDVLWTVVNERDGLGDETPPDYLTSVRDGAFYGWPYCYWDRVVDDRVPQDPAMVARALTPDYALGGHTASLGLCWVPAGTLPGFPEGMAIGQHGSWNRSKLSGYRLAFVPFENGRPSGPAREILTGFLAPDEKVSYGRPVGVTLGPDGSLLMADDVGDVIWRVTGADDQAPNSLEEETRLASGTLRRRARLQSQRILDPSSHRCNGGIELISPKLPSPRRSRLTLCPASSPRHRHGTVTAELEAGHQRAGQRRPPLHSGRRPLPYSGR